MFVLAILGPADTTESQKLPVAMAAGAQANDLTQATAPKRLALAAARECEWFGNDHGGNAGSGP